MRLYRFYVLRYPQTISATVICFLTIFIFFNIINLTYFRYFLYTQFEIVGLANNVRYIGDFPCLTFIDGKPVYNRFLIKHVLQ